MSNFLIIGNSREIRLWISLTKIRLNGKITHHQNGIEFQATNDENYFRKSRTQRSFVVKKFGEEKHKQK